MQKYMVEYKEYDTDDRGFCYTSSYLSVNCAGYYLEDDIDKIDPMNIIRSGGRRDYVFCYVTQGSINLYIENERYTVQDGFFIIPPNIPHYYNNKNTNKPFEIYWVHFTGCEAENFLKQSGLSGSYFFKSGRVNEIPNMIETLVRELTFKLDQYENVTQSILMYILSVMARICNYKNKKSENLFVDPRMQKTLEYVYLYYKQDITVKQLANMAQLSESRFSSLFKETFSISPLNYLTSYRIKRSCYLLRHTEFAISQIAEMVGFNDTFYFSRLFKKKIGISPSQYRSKLNPEIFDINLVF